ncbi:MAG: bifunctional 2-methylcitrate dehydratase/aconitate hydratase [Ectothiorhodospiraceae bacterium]|nr:bifunctional 2-methylcitrate dehydratase/aconitate hydratase [Ectothiorhodospiraceae bacterium]
MPNKNAAMKFRQALHAEIPLQIAGVINAYSALLAEQAGFKALYLSGAGVANACFAIPDIGLTHFGDILQEAKRITTKCDLPLLVDIDTGFSNEISSPELVSQLIEAGVAAIHIEDQVTNKRCGHLDGKQLVSSEVMQQRIRAMVEHNDKNDLIIMARTDACSVEGLEPAIKRAIEYQEAGAEMIFAEALSSLADYHTFTTALNVPVLANMTEFGVTPLFTQKELARVNIAMALYPLSAFRAMNQAALLVYQTIKHSGTQREVTGTMQTREALYKILDYTSSTTISKDVVSTNSKEKSKDKRKGINTPFAEDSTPSKPRFDGLLVDIADYCFSDHHFSSQTMSNARIALMDAISCALSGLQDVRCVKHLQAFQHNNPIRLNKRLLGANLDSGLVQSTYNISCLMRWLDYNDTWLAREWGHPSDNIGAILACADYHSRHSQHSQHSQGKTWRMVDVLNALIIAYEIQGILALDNSFNEQGLDHVILVRLASTAIAVKLLGGNKAHLLNALSNALMDGVPLRLYRQGDNTGQRKSWAAADASSRGVNLAMQAINGEPGYPAVLTDNKWGFNSVILNHKPLIKSQEFNHYVIDNILYKVSYPVEFHAQTAVESAVELHRSFKSEYGCQIENIVTINIYSHSAAMRIINKTGPLSNPADRDHCLQYAVAVALLTGDLSVDNYQNSYANISEVDCLRKKIHVTEDTQYSLDYYDPHKRAIPNRLEITYSDNHLMSHQVMYPLGHPRRRDEALPLLKDKFTDAIQNMFAPEKADFIVNLSYDDDSFMDLPIQEWLDYLMPSRTH